jgi:hypothetical protein
MNDDMGLLKLRPRTHEPASGFPPLDPPLLARTRPSPLRDELPEPLLEEPPWRGRTARAQYRDSEIYEPLSAVLLGPRGLRTALLVAFLVLSSGVIGWFAWDTWDAAQTTDGQALVVAAIAIGVVAGWAATGAERSYRLRRRFRLSALARA